MLCAGAILSPGASPASRWCSATGTESGEKDAIKSEKQYENKDPAEARQDLLTIFIFKLQYVGLQKLPFDPFEVVIHPFGQSEGASFHREVHAGPVEGKNHLLRDLVCRYVL